MSTHIVVSGGGGFSMSADHRASAADRFILSLTDKPNPLVCFVPTASGDNGLYISQFFNAYSGLGVRTSVLTLWTGAADSIARMDEADVFIIGGGNTVNLLALWSAHGVGDKLRSYTQDQGRDIVIAGNAAGAAALYEACATDGFGNGISALPFGLGLLPGSFCPHYNSEPDRAPRYQQLVDTCALPAGYAVDDAAGIHYLDGQVQSFWAERTGAGVYRVEPAENGARISAETVHPLPS
ncbi:Type 1 glutamine amidotransferase-like domain-containing protein [Dermatophilus congolensis]|nr:Type 1 glutamine amidotransferase-like domain-containing protein [Dermatophilus congolensis]MBO3141361.1 type 1 glutamine amidotransferase-like domain-containing protein [Dermatophilus congolensis]MBO3144598.1 type 1 glutamine amidotransferase-like domain-containing protein [Dermatophilus congolensis]MBO3148065.1 type 1 glutamine amidotransferase-like domain-containing protein [Dermatophilus congolensis]MBO3150345.1 type 1 glutamine amidotransferase-like domain-containing protein [Dermatophi